jgi:hypothetical protein
MADTSPPDENVRGLTFGSVRADAATEIKESWDFGNKVLAIAILVCVIGLYLYFSFWLG